MFWRWLCSRHVLKAVRYGSGPRQLVDVYLALDDGAPIKGEAPVVVFVTGGAWMIGHRLWAFLMGHVFQHNGVLMFSIDYRNFPQAHLSGMIDDVEE
eukprot:376141-Prymnesium_polylepis.1